MPNGPGDASFRVAKSTNEHLPAKAIRPAVAGDEGRDFCRLVRVAGAEWGAGQSLQQGSRLGAGRIKLIAGAAEFRFDNGVHAICTGPAELELRVSMHAWLHYGQVVFRVPRTGIGFELETHDAVIVDLGTEFGVRIDEPAASPPGEVATSNSTVRDGTGTELQVFEGEVIANVKSGQADVGSQKHRVQGGQRTINSIQRPSSARVLGGEKESDQDCEDGVHDQASLAAQFRLPPIRP